MPATPSSARGSRPAMVSRVARLSTAVTLLVAGCIGTGTAAPALNAAPGQDAGLDDAVPAPESVLGHPIGERAIHHAQVLEYLEQLAAASPFVTLTEYGRTHEGRALVYATITSRENHARLDRIRADAAKLADPRTLGGADAGAIIERLPGIAWLAYGIHGDEMSPCDAAVQVAYLLAAGTDDATVSLRNELVVHVDPLQNPDGRERYLNQLDTLQGKVPNSDYQSMRHSGLWSAGRGNHYLFDLNRDWLMLVHPETRARVKTMLEWNPHFLVDSHEMSGLDTYLFDPPREPINDNLSDVVMEWRRTFSADQARAFDDHGWSYYTRGWYEEWYPGYTNGWASLLGTIGLLYEAPSLNGGIVKQASGEVVPYRQAVRQNVVGSIANLHTLRRNRRAILRDYFEDRQAAVSDAGPTFLVRPGADRSRLARFQDLMTRHGIEHAVADRPLVATNAVDIRGRQTDQLELPAGTVVIETAQPHRRLLTSFLEFDPRLSDEFLQEERAELENRRGSRIYDTTAWNLAMAYDLDAYWAESVDAGRGGPEPGPVAPPAGGEATYGWLIDGMDADIYVTLARLFGRGCHPRVASKPFGYRERSYQPGAILLRRHENPPDLDAAVEAAVAGTGVHAVPVDTALARTGPDLGGQRFHLLHEPRVAIASQWPVSTGSFGAVWHRFDARLGLRVSPVNAQGLGNMDLRKYNVLILPSGFAWSAVLDGGAGQRVRDWVEDGGTLIAIGGAASYLAGEKHGLSSVRRRRDVLDELDAYAEAVVRERAALDVNVDPDDVWGREPAHDDPGNDDPGNDDPGNDDAPTGASPSPREPDQKARERQDRWQRMFSVQGAFADTTVNPEHFLCFGIDGPLPVLISGSTAYMSQPPVETAVRLADGDRLRLSGLVWPEARQRLADSAYVTRESRGRGQVILFASDPVTRGYLEGTARLLENAVFLGPGMGSDQPIPW